jgi:hypothetical protein
MEFYLEARKNFNANQISLHLIQDIYIFEEFERLVNSCKAASFPGDDHRAALSNGRDCNL